MSATSAGGDEPPDRSWIAALPKAEVHVHLEGSVAPGLVAEAARRTGVALPWGAQGPEVHDLDELLSVLDLSCGLLTEDDELERLAYELSMRSSTAGIRYSDVIVNPTHWPSWHHRLDRFVDALDRGFAAAEHDGHTSVSLCLSIERNQSRLEALELVEWIVERPRPRIVALSIDGSEAAAGRTGPRFAEAFARAEACGLRRCAHAGESSGPEGVRDAIELLRAERIDHGIRSVEDPAVVADLARRGIPLGICPTSNVRLGVVDSFAAHPIERLRAAGVPVSVNTDDPVLLGTDIVTETEVAAATFGWTHSVLLELARTSVDASFAPPETKLMLRRELDAFAQASTLR